MRREKGITLVALVITVIIIIILGVGIYKFEYGRLPKFAQNIKILIPKFTNCAKKVDK